ncbi:MFS transporter [Novosphingobium flavum]|uniref:MFS transporter n=1 Tax=Novosphingobium flavum TaxID=1778672 RepID=A0A7X1KK52_9SPHN|nr:MFS transporter [Novosphingobium flavum]MBC2664166.1 MFS transporter [Novosphingobium flavum]
MRIRTEIGTAVLLALAFGTVMLDRMVQLFLGTDLTAEFSLTGSQLGLLAGVVSLSWALSTMIFGALSDRIGRKRVLVPAMIAFSVASLLTAFARSFGELLAMRALLGFCEGPCWSVIMAFMSDRSSPDRRGRNIGIVNCAGSLAGSALAPIFAAQITTAFGWRAAFLVAGVPGFVLAMLIAYLLDEPAVRSKSERMGTSDLRRLMRQPSLWLCLAGASCFTTFVISSSIFAPIYLIADQAFTKSAAGLVMGLSGLGGFIYALVGPLASDRIGRRKILVLAAGLSCLMPITVLAGGGIPVAALGAGMVLLTAAPVIATLMLIVLPVEYSPRALGASAIGFVAIGAEGIGATIGPVLAGIVAESWGHAAVMWFCSATMVVVLLIALVLPEPAHETA